MFLNIAHYQSCSMIPCCLTKVPPGLRIQVSDPGSSWPSCFNFCSKFFFKNTISVSNSGCGFREGSGSLLLSDQIISFSWRYLRKMRYNQQAEPPPPFYMWTPFTEILDPPLKSLDPDQDQHSDLGPNCLQRLPADHKSQWLSMK